jgi:cytochrome c553
MNNDRRFPSIRDRWFAIPVGGTAALFLIALFIGFVWLPSAQEDALFKGLWNSFCGAAGVPRGWLAATEPALPPPHGASAVVLVPDLDRHAADGGIGRGGTLALKCTMCHGTRGVTSADIPSLAGIDAAAIFKQLMDFRSGARNSAVMRPLVMDLSEQDMRDVSAFYASLPATPQQSLASAPDIVAVGAPMRNIAPCGSCHGAMTAKLGAPALDGQPLPYLKAQLEAFARGTRRNDINGQMRNVARNMSPADIDASAIYYAGNR